MTENIFTKYAAASSRRRFIAALASLPLFDSVTSAEIATKDEELINLGRRFASLASKIDHAMENNLDLPWTVLTHLGEIQDQILKYEATTTAGLCAKAQTVCWGRLGDLNPTKDMNPADRMALSIIRDLIRLHNPSLENPGALTRLLKEIEENASQSPAQSDNWAQ